MRERLGRREKEAGGYQLDDRATPFFQALILRHHFVARWGVKCESGWGGARRRQAAMGGWVRGVAVRGLMESFPQLFSLVEKKIKKSSCGLSPKPI